MLIRVRTRDLKLSDEQREHIEKRLAFAVGRFERLIAAVDVMLEDRNGPRGGVDKQCRMRLEMRRGEPLLTTAIDSDVDRSIDHAAARLSRSLSRLVERGRASHGMSYSGPFGPTSER